MGQASDESIYLKLAIEIGGSAFAGVVLGVLIALYMRFVGRELLLFVAGIVYVTMLVTATLHLDAVLVFLTAGFLVSNYARGGETFIHSVEKLSTPVYVVFFTLAGAKLHLDEVMHLFGFAVALVIVRVIAIYIGVKAGAILGNADEGTKKYGWMGFLSQAGVAITFASFLADPNRFPESVHALSSLLIAGVAINEVIGPILLKVALSLAGEIGDPKQTAVETEEASPVVRFAEWPKGVEEVDWGQDEPSGAPKADHELADLQKDLRDLVRDVADGPMERFKESASSYVLDLRREFLRQYRRIAVQARAVTEAETEEAKLAEEATLTAMLHAEQAELAERWRTIALTRSAQLRSKTHWNPGEMIEVLDGLAARVPEVVEVPLQEMSFVTRDDDPFAIRVHRFLLRFRRGALRLFGREMKPREVYLRELVGYHFSGLVPADLESTAALLIDAEGHIAGRTRNLYDSLVLAYDSMVKAVAAEHINVEAHVETVREDMEEGLNLALGEVDRMAQEGANRIARSLAKGLRGVKEELPIFGTFDLPERHRRAMLIFRDRVRALERLEVTLDELRESCGGEYSLLALELELVGLEAQLKGLVDGERRRAEGEVERRVLHQISRASASLSESLEAIEATFGNNDEVTGDELSASIRATMDNAEKTAGDAARVVEQMRIDLLDDQKYNELMRQIRTTAGTLTQRYDVIGGRLMRGDARLPTPIPSVEVPFRELVSDYVETTVMEKLYRAAQSAAKELEPVHEMLSEMEQLIAFSVEQATAELEVAGERAVPSRTRRLVHEMIFSHLDRIAATGESYEKASKPWPGTFGQEVQDAVLGALDELRGQLADGKITQAKLNVIRKTASRRRLAAQARSLPDSIRDTVEQLKSTAVSVVGADRIAKIRLGLGLPTETEHTSFQETSFIEVEAPVEVPAVYKRLFSSNAMQANDVLTGRDEPIRRGRDALSIVGPRQRRRAVALVGPDGVGRAAVGSAISRGARWKNVVRITLDEPQTVEQVDALLERAFSAQLVVIDGIEWLVSAKPGGYAPIRRFVDGMLTDSGNRAWLVYADSLFWRNVSAIAPIEDAFPEVIRLEPLSQEELMAAVMERHRHSNFNHSFDRTLGGARVHGVLERVLRQKPFEFYFSELHTASGGLIHDALRLWLASISGIEDETVLIGPVPTSHYRALKSLQDDDLHTLFLVARQGWIDAKSLASLRRRDKQSANAELARLAHLGILVGEQDALRIAPHLRGVVSRVLAAKGWG